MMKPLEAMSVQELWDEADRSEDTLDIYGDWGYLMAIYAEMDRRDRRGEPVFSLGRFEQEGP